MVELEMTTGQGGIQNNFRSGLISEFNYHTTGVPTFQGMALLNTHSLSYADYSRNQYHHPPHYMTTWYSFSHYTYDQSHDHPSTPTTSHMTTPLFPPHPLVTHDLEP